MANRRRFFATAASIIAYPHAVIAQSTVTSEANTNAMVHNSVHFTFAPEDADKAQTMLRELRDASRKEAGVVAFDVIRGQDDPNAFALWEVYRDAAAWESHAATEHFQRLVVNGVRTLARQRNGVKGAEI